jgi:chemotaxis protein MotB
VTVAKRQQHEEHENHERWLVSYADFITLLFAFFVVMYATSRVDTKKLVQVENAIKFAMHFKGTGGVRELPLFAGPPTDAPFQPSILKNGKPPRVLETTPDVEVVRKRLEQKLRKYLLERPDLSNVIKIEQDGRKLTVRLSAGRFFDASQAVIRPEMIPVLDAIAGELTALRRPLRIDGHTDDARLASGRFRDNWELSASRAAAVASYVQRAFKADGRLLSATGYGATRPIALNATTAGREANRRIEMVVELVPTDTLERLGK